MRNLLFMLSCTIFFYVFVEVGLFQDNNILGKRFAQLPDVAQSIFAVMFYAFMLAMVFACIHKVGKLSEEESSNE